MKLFLALLSVAIGACGAVYTIDCLDRATAVFDRAVETMP